MKTLNTTLVMIVTLLSLTACSGDSDKAATKSAEPEAMAPVTNRIDIPPEVRQNLGITFAKVERRAVASTLRYPGTFELDPAARRVHGALLAGEVIAKVAINDTVKVGDLLATIRSPQASEMAKELTSANAAITEANGNIDVLTAKIPEAEAEMAAAMANAELSEKELAAHRLQTKAAKETTEFWQSRIKELAEQREKGLAVADQLAEAKAKFREANEREYELATGETLIKVGKARHLNDADIATKRRGQIDHQLKALRELHTAAIAKRDAELKHVAAVMQVENLTPEAMLQGVIEVKAASAGIVTQAVNSGQWVSAGETVATVMEPSALRLRFQVPVSDLARVESASASTFSPISDRPNSSVVTPVEGALRILRSETTAPGTVDAIIIPHAPFGWGLIGLVARAEIVVAGGSPRIAIPMRATIRDGLEVIAFVRDPNNPDRVIRQPVVLGANDGVWAVADTGVGPNDEVVLDGIYELKLTGGGKAEAGGHFHADGTFHAGKD